MRIIRFMHAIVQQNFELSQRAGSVFIKIGQLPAMRPDPCLIPMDGKTKQFLKRLWIANANTPWPNVERNQITVNIYFPPTQKLGTKSVPGCGTQ